MVNPWIEHVKNYAKDHNLSYSNALREAKTSYKTKMTGGRRDPSYIVRAIYGKNRTKFDVGRIRNPSKHLTTMFEKKKRTPETKTVGNPPNKYLANAIASKNNFASKKPDSQQNTLTRIKTLYYCIVNNIGSTKQINDAKKIIEKGRRAKAARAWK